MGLESAGGRRGRASSTSSTRTCSAALRLVSVQQGFDPRDFALVAFGGAGPLHANALGRLTGAWPVIVPPSPGRAVRARRRHHQPCATSRPAPCCAGSPSSRAASSRQILERARRRGRAARWPSRALPREQQTVGYQVDVRYHGQGFEIPVDVDDPRRPTGWPPSASASTPSTTGCSPSCSTSTTSWSTPAPRSPGRARTSRRSRWTRATATRPARAWPARTRSTSRASTCRRRRLRPGAAARRRRGHAVRRSSPRWTPPPSSCPGTRPPCTRRGSLLIRPDSEG